MASVHKSVLVPYSAQHMYDLVEDVEDYPAFLPWCGGVEVFERTSDHTVVRIDINFHGIRAYFTTENVNEPPKQIVMTLRDGPFRKLDGNWNFLPLAEQGCKIEFSLSYEFATATLEKLIGSVFDQIADSFIDAFVRRAQSTGPSE